MLAPQSPTDAYRSDLAAAAGRRAFGAHDGLWLLLAELVVRAGRATDAIETTPIAAVIRDGTPILAMLSAVGGEAASDASRSADPVASHAADDGESVRRFADAVQQVIEQVEDAGALHLATSMLVALHDAVSADVDVARRGGLVAQRARVARKLGALDAAHDLYDRAVQAGRAARDPALIARGLIGQAVVARRRGNYPASRERYARALSVARRGGHRALVGLAHQGLLVAAGAGGDFDTAVRHGWLALEHLADDPAAQADVLGNLAALSGVAGHHRAALQGYLAAARRSAKSHIRLPTLAGAAVSAAHVGDRECLETVTRTVEAELTRGGLPYEHAHALTALGEAWAIAGSDTAGEPFRARGLALARAHGFHELVFESERAPTRFVAARDTTSAAPVRRVAASTRRILRAIESLGSETDQDHAAGLARAR